MGLGEGGACCVPVRRGRAVLFGAGVGAKPCVRCLRESAALGSHAQQRALRRGQLVRKRFGQSLSPVRVQIHRLLRGSQCGLALAERAQKAGEVVQTPSQIGFKSLGLGLGVGALEVAVRMLRCRFGGMALSLPFGQELGGQQVRLQGR